MEVLFLAHSGEFPSTLISCLVATAPPFDSCPFHPFSTPSAHITLFTMMTSTITVYFVRDKNVPTFSTFSLSTLCPFLDERKVLFYAIESRDTCRTLFFFKCTDIEKHLLSNQIKSNQIFISPDSTIMLTTAMILNGTTRQFRFMSL